MKEKGALTIVQDEASSIVFGMPGEAIKLGAATYVLSPEKIVSILMDLVK
jgi:two-component system chemotaxis response regulator CheB